MLGQFDACGDLLVADISYDKNERNVILSMEQHIARVQGGWVGEYAYLVKVLKAGKEVVVDNRQGTISWQKGQHGNITSASDKFTSMENVALPTPPIVTTRNSGCKRAWRAAAIN